MVKDERDGDRAESGGWMQGSKDATGCKLGNPEIWTESNSGYIDGGAQGFSSLIVTFRRNRKSIDNFRSVAVDILKSGRSRSCETERELRHEKMV